MLNKTELSALDQAVAGGESMLVQLDKLGRVTSADLKNRSRILEIAREAITHLERSIEHAESNRIDAWLDRPTMNASPGEVYARWWLEHARMPAWKQVIYKPVMAQHKLFCTWKGKRWRVTGASSMGDVWLVAHFGCETGYDQRVIVTECSDWSASAPCVDEGCPQAGAFHVCEPSFAISTGGICSVCKEPQFKTPSGLVCKNGHGGA